MQTKNNSRVSYIGITSGCQSDKVGSTPITRSRMNKLLATIVFVFHTIWIVAVIISTPLALFSVINKVVPMFLLGMTLFGDLIFHHVCPLTVLENKFLKNHEAHYQGSFLGYYLKKWLNISFSEGFIHTILISFILIFLLLITILDGR